jgi:hypothetical protein
LADYDAAGYDRVYESIIRSIGLMGACGGAGRLPRGVTAQLRRSATARHLVLLNFGPSPVEVPLQGAWQDVESNVDVVKSAYLAAFGARVLMNR